MRELKYTLTLTYDEIAALSKALYQQTKQNEEDAALFQDKSPELYKIVTRDLDDCKRLQKIIDTLTPTLEEDEQ